MSRGGRGGAETLKDVGSVEVLWMWSIPVGPVRVRRRAGGSRRLSAPVLDACGPRGADFCVDTRYLTPDNRPVITFEQGPKVSAATDDAPCQPLDRPTPSGMVRARDQTVRGLLLLGEREGQRERWL